MIEPGRAIGGGAGRGAAILATGFVADDEAVGTLFPSAGGKSSDPAVQAIYWRCIAVFFTTARISNPELRLALFSNVDPPEVDGIALGAVLDRLGVERRRVPLTHRLAHNPRNAWGNVLYFFDVLDSLAGEAGDLPIALTDSDLVVTRPIDALFARLSEFDFVGYRVDSTPDEDINGMTRRTMAAAAAEIDGRAHGETIAHFGGELLVATPESWRRHRPLFAELYERAAGRRGAAGAALTEEHVWSIAFAVLGPRVGTANDLLKRIWTSPRYSTAAPGDERLAMWHLPAEKRYGLRDLFHDLAARDFTADSEELRVLAGRRCGVPAKGLAKLSRDGVRQVAAKMGLRR